MAEQASDEEEAPAADKEAPAADEERCPWTMEEGERLLIPERMR